MKQKLDLIDWHRIIQAASECEEYNPGLFFDVDSLDGELVATVRLQGQTRTLARLRPVCGTGGVMWKASVGARTLDTPLLFEAVRWVVRAQREEAEENLVALKLITGDTTDDP